MATDSTSFEGALFCAGNPLLDLSSEVPLEFAEKYGVTMNNAILAEEKHIPMYKEMVDTFEVERIAGGATLNTGKIAQWVSDRENLVSYVGCVGKDEYAAQLTKAAADVGVTTAFLEDAEHGTGTCAVLINAKERSLVANLSAANHYKLDHWKTDAVQALVSKAKYFYSSGFFLTVSPETMVETGKHAAANGKSYMMNLAAPFLCQFFKDQMHSVLPYCDFVFGNESEAQAYGEANGMKDASVEDVALAIAALPKASGTYPRTVVITQGGDDTVVARFGKVSKYPTPPLAEADMVDLNGAGDAFVGGFLARYIEGDSLEACVACGQWAAGHIIKRSGATFDSTVRYSA